jgi:hypothetical protein
MGKLLLSFTSHAWNAVLLLFPPLPLGEEG